MEFKAKTFEELTTTELYEILKARAAVFVMEQKILYQDMDDTDYGSLHCFIEEDGRVIAYLRAYYADPAHRAVKVGRVLTIAHGQGMGRALLEQSLPDIRTKMKCDRICMDAQRHAVGFYGKFGFRVTSGEFLEEGIVHVRMELT